jgi:hypothetical protein
MQIYMDADFINIYISSESVPLPKNAEEIYGVPRLGSEDNLYICEDN